MGPNQVNQGRVETSSCSRKSDDKLAANRSTKGTASASGTVRGKLINAVNLYVKVGI